MLSELYIKTTVTTKKTSPLLLGKSKSWTDARHWNQMGFPGTDKNNLPLQRKQFSPFHLTSLKAYVEIVLLVLLLKATPMPL